MGMIFGVVHGALVCEAEGFPVESYAEFLPAIFPVAASQAHHLALTIAHDKFGETEAALSTYAVAIKAHLDACLAKGINADFPSFGHRWLNGAMEAGFGDQEISALIKTLRPA
jgi:hypothetical protein